MTIFVAVLQGVYRHAIVGASPDVSKTIGLARESILAEPDYYHNIVVVETSDQLTPEKVIGFWNWHKSEQRGRHRVTTISKEPVWHAEEPAPTFGT